jgi:hypothetical protein
MMNNKNNSEDQAKMIGETLGTLVKKLGELTGNELMIGWGMFDGENLTEGAVSTDGLEYGNAAKMYLGIGGFIADYYGGNLECPDCDE